MNTTMKTLAILAALPLSASLTGCFAPKDVAAARDQVQAIQFEPFALDAGAKLVTKSNKIFLWPTNMTGDNVREASRISRAMDDFEDKEVAVIGDLNPLNESLKDLVAVETQTSAKRDAVDLKARQEPALKRVVAQLEKKCETECSDSDRQKLAQKKADLEQLQAELPVLRQQLADLEQKLSDEAAKADPTGEKRAKRADLNGQLATLQTQASDRAQELQQWVDGYDQPDSIEFSRDAGGALSVKIYKWKAPVKAGEPSAADYSTEDGSIRDVVYKDLGGRFTFEVVTADSVYKFRLGRTEYGPTGRARKTGKTYFAGEITRDDGRKGTIKLLDADLKSSL